MGERNGKLTKQNGKGCRGFLRGNSVTSLSSLSYTTLVRRALCRSTGCDRWRGHYAIDMNSSSSLDTTQARQRGLDCRTTFSIPKRRTTTIGVTRKFFREGPDFSQFFVFHKSKVKSGIILEFSNFNF